MIVTLKWYNKVIISSKQNMGKKFQYTCILSISKIFNLFFEWPLKTGFPVYQIKYFDRTILRKSKKAVYCTPDRNI